ncbi:MAG: TrbI/VirB10 family protein [Erythrobacter sp.]|uniref:TrbI/VirB10 family protein n=1 Tax=Erythrobacter sp. TaxID=1042 RepID=UPI001AFFE8F7|nr:TrbI/VirB10 family protein [Erythrobacter sp.]MBO6767371.1 TrbI/VirB10 family protein [Erythrobacter sp.]
MKEEASEHQAADPESIVKLRGDAPRVVRLSRKAIGVASAIGIALVGGALIFALQPPSGDESEEVFNTEGVAVADGLVAGPRDYSEVPRLGPPLPGDLGQPILDAQDRGAVAALPPVGGAPPAPSAELSPEEAARQRLALEREAAIGSKLFFGSSAGANGQPANGPRSLEVPAPSSAEQDPGAGTSDFLDLRVGQQAATADQITSPPGAAILQAGSIIPAALITGIRSDQPGLVTAQVTQNVFDSPTGRILLIPQGARLIGEYEADVGFGQRRVLLAWTRLIFPDGRSLMMERQPASDLSGYAGLEDRVDYHWGGVFRASLISTLLGIGAEVGSRGDRDLVRALRDGAQDSISRTGEQIVSREIGRRPTLTIRPGYPVNVLVTRDMVLGSAP